MMMSTKQSCQGAKASPPSGSQTSSKTSSTPRRPEAERPRARSEEQPLSFKNTLENQRVEQQAQPESQDLLTPQSFVLPTAVALDRAPPPTAAAKPPPVPPAATTGPTQVDAMLGTVTKDVRLATDGQGKHMLRFEVSEGDLAGTRIAVSTDNGRVSAVLVPTEPHAIAPLEQALETMRTSLEGRGIDVTDLEVRSDGQGRDQQELEEGEADTAPAQGSPRAASPNVPGQMSESIDYYV